MGGLTRRLRVATLAACIGLLAALAAAPVARGAEPHFGTPTMDSSFGTGVDFRQPVEIDEPLERVELLVTTAAAIGPQVIDVAPPRGTGSLDLSYTLEVGGDDHLLPNTPLSARWRLTPAGGGAPVVGPPVSGVYADDRFDWKTAEGDIVRVHWYEGSQAFGERALRIGEEAVARTSDLLGVTETEPIDFFIYASQGPFYEALGPGTRENVGGQANADIRTLFADIDPGAIDDPWVDIVIPHELVHLVFDTAVDNPYHFPPRWLNEGLADYLSQGYDADYRAAVEAAASAGKLIPLEGLTGQFPTSGDRFYQAYAESVSAVDFLIREHGQDALVGLIRSYAEGRTDDEAFRDAIGMDVAAFDAAWRAELDAVEPTRYGPQPAPAGPLPADWAAGAGAGGGAAAGPGAATDAPGASAPARPSVSAGEPSSLVTPGLVVLLAALGFGAAAVLLVIARRPRGDAAT
jgi:hypothetical protein